MNINTALRFAVISIIIASCTTQGSIENDWNHLNLSGKVQLLKEASFNTTTRFGEILPVTKTSNYNIPNKKEFKFNEAGFIVEKKFFKSNGDLYQLIKNSYNGKNYLNESFTIGPKGDTLYQTLYEYDKKGQLTKETTYNLNGKLESESVFEYNNNGNLNEINGYDSSGERIYRRTFEYYDNGKKRNESIYYSSDLSFTYKYQYDENGRVTKRESYNEDGSLEFNEEYEYEEDSKGNWIRRISNSERNTELTIREIEYFDGIVSGDLSTAETTAYKNYTEHIKEKINDELASIAASSQGYFLKPKMLGGGGTSFEGINFNNINFKVDSLANTETIAYKGNARYKIEIIKSNRIRILVTPITNADPTFEAVVTPDNYEIEAID